eukprot:s2238_g9.t1
MSKDSARMAGFIVSGSYGMTMSCKEPRAGSQGPGADVPSSEAFEEIYELLGKLSPMRRAEALQRDLTEPERRGLESWILAGSRPSGQIEDSQHPQHPQLDGRQHGPCHAEGNPRSTATSSNERSSVGTLIQRSRVSGAASHWYFANIFLPGLHIVSRMRRDYHAALRDGEVLTGAKRFVKGALSTGHSFDEAIRTALASSLSGQSSSAAEVSNCSKMPGSKRRQARAGGAGKEPEALFLRFYAAVQLGGGFNSLLRSPCCWDLDSALAARRRLLMALDCQGQSPLAARRLRSLPHRICAEVLERLRLAHEALYVEQDSVAAAATAAARNFKRVSGALLQYRDDLWRRELRRALRRRRAAQVPAASRGPGPSWRPCTGEGVSRPWRPGGALLVCVSPGSANGLVASPALCNGGFGYTAASAPAEHVSKCPIDAEAELASGMMDRASMIEAASRSLRQQMNRSVQRPYAKGNLHDGAALDEPRSAENAQRRIRSAENQHRSISSASQEAPQSSIGTDPSASAAAGLGAFAGPSRMTDAFEQRKTRQPIPVESWGPRPPSRAGLPQKASTPLEGSLADGFVSTPCRGRWGMGGSGASSSVGRASKEREPSQGGSRPASKMAGDQARTGSKTSSDQALGAKVVGGTWASARVEPRASKTRVQRPLPAATISEANDAARSRGRERRATTQTRGTPEAGAADLGVFGRGQPPMTKSLSGVLDSGQPHGRARAMEEHGYSVMRVLGQGGGCNSRVYEVKDREGQLRVVKQLPWVADTDRENALREVRLLSSMRHPCIVPYLESFLVRSTPSLPSEDILCLVMSRCDRDLRQECLRVRLEWELNGCRDGFGRAHIAEMLILSWLAQLTWGLQHLHSRKFLHRDLKPQNVLLAQNGKRVMLADFGVAGQVEHTEDLRRSIVGTPAFMSPEMLEGRPYNSKTDQWALGCVLFEMMALEPPFAGRCDSYAAVVSAVLHAPPVQAPSGYSPPLSGTLEGLLARKPHNRPSNRELLRSDLLRDPFHDFLQSLDSLVGDRKWAKPRTSTSEPRASTGTAAAAGTAVGLARRAIPVLRQLHFAPEAASSHGPNHPVQSAVTEPFSVDQLDAASPSDSDLGSPWAKSQELSATGSSMQVGSASARTPGLPGLVEDDFGISRSPSVSAPHRATSNHTEGCSYASDFESDSGQVGAESNSSGERDLDLLEDFQEPGDSADNVSHSEHGFASTAEWRQLIAEAEALLVPLPEVQATEEAHKLRAALASSLGGEDKVDTALNFLRDRRPLGDTVEADELLLQVELLDLLGDEGILKLSAAGPARFRGASTPSSRAASRPEALADPLALGVSGCGLGDAAAWPASPQSCGGTPPTRRSGRHQSAEPMQMEDVEVEDHVLHPSFRRTDAAPPQVIVTRSNQAAQSRVNLRRSVDQRALRERDRSMPFSTSLDVDFLSLFAS